ncbi:MAG: T9SS type A sorting domain-containing protein, partial [Candidatus Fermentibacteraceae bacterium]|nr:T9SS type A sorting domain-containing protein [Candidatus Fermentibacteraceae bacterium]
NTDGLLVGHVDGITLSAAMGLTIDSDGYIWASNPDDDMIYQIEVTTGIEEGSTSPLDTRIIGVNRNPFQSSAVITGDGFNNAVIDIFDLTGRRVLSAAFPGSYTWNAVKMPSGSYFVRISDSAGSSTARLMKIH